MPKFFRQPITPWCNLELLNVWIGNGACGKTFRENFQRYRRLKSPQPAYCPGRRRFRFSRRGETRIKKGRIDFKRCGRWT